MTRSSCRSSALSLLGVVAVVAVVTACGGGPDPVPGMSGAALPAEEATATADTTVPDAPTESDEAAESEPDRDGGDIDGDAALQDLADAPVADDPPKVVDDHADTGDGATPVAVGGAVPGSVDYEYDIDFFVFEAEAAGLYRIDVSLETLPDSVAVLYDAELYDAEESELAYNDDSEDGLNLASRIDWLAESAGTFYVAVRGWEENTGSYTLSVARVADPVDIADDHADTGDGATPVVVGEAVSGSLDYGDDVDFFVFEAEAGEWYRIDVSLGTLPDSVAVLYDAEESELAYNDDREDGLDLASRIDWQAESAGTFYVAVGGFDERAGSYTLTVDHVVDGEFDTVGGTVPVAVSKATMMPMDC